MINKNEPQQNPLIKRQRKDTKLIVEYEHGLHPLITIYYQNRRITALIPTQDFKSNSNILRIAKRIIEESHSVNPFKTVCNE